ncbi:Glycosyl hydrolases family 16 [Nocardioides alpinus]|uniref:Glycosyl hydrolases family 16 n=1 Tax=Nocardioides alpinus TaxID=748909 RepID=A0A1I1A268_9ACTN|nr:glycoside hydrolase family 16 protein [Nocardioides alpinus]SFB32084.1 Glycosyl hydrolases family 16 [Nocardioides alpinus]
MSSTLVRPVLGATAFAAALLLTAVAGVPGNATAVTPSADLAPVTTAYSTSRPAAAGRLTVRPAISQPGRRPAAASRSTQVLAEFPSARKGQRVALQRNTVGTWKTIARTRLHRTRSAVFALPRGRGRYRAVTLSGSGSTRVTTNTVRGRRFTVLFKDDFSGAQVDHAKWSDQETLAPAYMRACSQLSPLARTVSDGVLHMGVAYDSARAGQACEWQLNGNSGSHPYMLNTQLYTRGKFDFTYGYAAVRMKMHRSKGMHASFWLQPTNWYTPGDPTAGTEIDAVEYFGASKAGSTIGSFVHYYGADGEHYKRGGLYPRANTLMPATHEWWNAFHVFSVEWTPTAYVFRVDGREFHRETQAVSKAPEYLLLSMLTSDYNLAKLTPEGIGQTAAVDWVRVWAR